MIVDGFVTQIHFDGEFSDAVQWEAFAIGKLRDLLRAGARGVTVMQVGDVKLRTVINRTSKMAQVWVEAGQQYMESAYLDLRILARTEPEFYMPAFLTGTRTDAYNNADKNRKVVDGDLSYACGSKTLRSEVSYSIGTAQVPIHFGEPDGTKLFCKPGAITNSKLTRLSVRPSMYTGMMRRYVQALYGTNRTDFTYINNPTGVGSYLCVSKTGIADYSGENFDDKARKPPQKSVQLHNTLKSSGILYDEATDGHWLITADTSSITYRKMKPVTAVDKKAWKTEEEHDRYLASLSPVGDEITIPVDMSILSGWSFPAYSWKFNSSGREACGVLFKENADLFGNVLGFLTKVATVNFLVLPPSDDTPATVTATVNSGAETLYVPVSSAAFLVPGITTMGPGLIHVWAPYRAENAPSGSAPVYAYYDANDSLQVCSVNFPGDTPQDVKPATVVNFPYENATFIFPDMETYPADGSQLSWNGGVTSAIYTSAATGVTTPSIADVFQGTSKNSNDMIYQASLPGPETPGMPDTWFPKDPGYLHSGWDMTAADYAAWSEYYWGVWGSLPAGATQAEIDEAERQTTLNLVYKYGGTDASYSETVTAGSYASRAYTICVPWDDAASIITGVLNTSGNHGKTETTYTKWGNNTPWFWYGPWNEKRYGVPLSRAGLVFSYASATVITSQPTYHANATFYIDSHAGSGTYTLSAESVDDSYHLAAFFYPPTGSGTLPPEVGRLFSVATTATGSGAKWQVSSDGSEGGIIGSWPPLDPTLKSPAGSV